MIKGGIPKGARLLEDKAGRLLPTVVDGKGRIMKQGRVVGKAGKAAKGAATAALIIVEVAHAISNHDCAKRVKKVELGVGRLLKAHESGLRSRLEAIYRHSKELLHNGLDNLSPEDQRQLHGHCCDLFELRARWRDDFSFRLESIENADPHWLNKLFFWRRGKATQEVRRRRANEVEAGLTEVQFMHFSLMLQMALSGAAGRMQEFRGATLPEECGIWSNLEKIAQGRVRQIAGPQAKEFKPFLNGLRDLTAVWSDCASRGDCDPRTPQSIV